MPPINYQHGAPCWLDLTTSDLEQAKAFYTDLFGWDIEDMGEDFGHYHIATKNGKQIAGMMGKQDDMGDMPDSWTVYLGADNAQAHVDEAIAAGATLTIPVMDVMDLGKMAVLQAADNSVYGVWEPNKHRGFEIFGEPGAPAWFENSTKDFEAAVAFYSTVTGTSEVPMPEGAMDEVPSDEQGGFKYYTGAMEGDEKYGICDVSQFMPAEVPSHWEVYYLVEDTDAAVEKIKANGGAVVAEPTDSFFGRFAIVTDPTGTIFRVIK